MFEVVISMFSKTFRYLMIMEVSQFNRWLSLTSFRRAQTYGEITWILFINIWINHFIILSRNIKNHILYPECIVERSSFDEIFWFEWGDPTDSQSRDPLLKKPNKSQRGIYVFFSGKKFFLIFVFFQRKFDFFDFQKSALSSFFRPKIFTERHRLEKRKIRFFSQFETVKNRKIHKKLEFQEKNLAYPHFASKFTKENRWKNSTNNNS